MLWRYFTQYTAIVVLQLRVFDYGFLLPSACDQRHDINDGFRLIIIALYVLNRSMVYFLDTSIIDIPKTRIASTIYGMLVVILSLNMPS